MARLDELCILNMGQSPDSSSYNEVGAGLPFFQGNADFGVLHPEIRVWCNKPVKIAHPGDILISVRAPIGAMNIADKDCCIGRGLAALTVNENLCSRKYIWYAVSNKVDELNAKGTGSTFKAISKGVLGETEIILPPLDKQLQIAAVLDKLSNLIALRKQQLAKMDELVKARFVEMFDTCEDTVRLSDVADITGGLTKNSKRNKLNLKLPYLRVANVSFASIDVSEMLEIGLTEAERDKTILKYGDLLFVEGNGSPDQIGRVAIWRDEIIPCVHQNHLIKARIDHSKILPVFTMYYFMSQSGREQIKSKAVSTSGLYTLSTSRIAGFRLPAPPMVLQKQFASFVEQTDKSKLTIQQSLDKLEVLKKSLMQEYFGFEQV